MTKAYAIERMFSLIGEFEASSDFEQYTVADRLLMEELETVANIINSFDLPSTISDKTWLDTDPTVVQDYIIASAGKKFVVRVLGDELLAPMVAEEEAAYRLNLMDWVFASSDFATEKAKLTDLFLNVIGVSDDAYSKVYRDLLAEYNLKTRLYSAFGAVLSEADVNYYNTRLTAERATLLGYFEANLSITPYETEAIAALTDLGVTYDSSYMKYWVTKKAKVLRKDFIRKALGVPLDPNEMQLDIAELDKLFTLLVAEYEKDYSLVAFTSEAKAYLTSQGITYDASYMASWVNLKAIILRKEFVFKKFGVPLDPTEKQLNTAELDKLFTLLVAEYEKAYSLTEFITEATAYLTSQGFVYDASYMASWVNLKATMLRKEFVYKKFGLPIDPNTLSVEKAELDRLYAQLIFQTPVPNDLLEDIKVETLAEGYSFNTDTNWELLPDTEGYIVVPQSVIKIDPTPTSSTITMKDSKLFDRARFSYVFTSSVYCDIAWDLEFTDIPVVWRKYITAKANRIHKQKITAFLPATTVQLQLQQLLADEERTRIKTMEYEMDVEDSNIFDDLSVSRALSRTSNPTGIRG